MKYALSLAAWLCLAMCAWAQDVILVSSQTVNNGKIQASQFDLVEFEIPLSVLPFESDIRDCINDASYHYSNYSGLNPFSPKDVNIRILIQGPESVFEIYGFYFQDYDYVDKSGNIINLTSFPSTPPVFNWSLKEGSESFRMRFAPQEVGLYTILSFDVYYKDLSSGNTLHFAPQHSFQSIQSSDDGLMGPLVISENDYFKRKVGPSSNEKIFVPHGMGIGWVAYNDYLLPHVNQGKATLMTNWLYFDDYIDAEANIIRVPVSNYTYNIEMDYLNNYIDRMPVAFELDNLFKIVESSSSDVMIELSLEHATLEDGLGLHGYFSNDPNDPNGANATHWDQSPYNSAGIYREIDRTDYYNILGAIHYNHKNGPCSKRIDFFTNSTAKEMYSRKLRYISSRWGYSRSLAFIEIFNELDLIINSSSPPDYIPEYFKNSSVRTSLDTWVRDMSQELELHDHYHNNLISVSIGHEERSEMDDASTFTSAMKGGIDLINWHSYSIKLTGLEKLYGTALIPRMLYDMPVIINENGTNNFNYPGDERCMIEFYPDRFTSIQIRKTGWYSFFSGSMSANIGWNWEAHDMQGVHSNVYSSLKNYVEDDRETQHEYSPTALNMNTISNGHYNSYFTIHSPEDDQGTPLDPYEFSILGLVRKSDYNKVLLYVDNKTAYWQNTVLWENEDTHIGSCADPVEPTHLTDHSGCHDSDHRDYNQIESGQFTIDNLKPLHDYYVDYYDPQTGLLLSGPGFDGLTLTTSANGSLTIPFKLTEFSYEDAEGGDVAIKLTICTLRFPVTCGFDENYIDYDGLELMNARSFDYKNGVLYYLTSNHQLRKITNPGTISQVDSWISDMPFADVNTEILIGLNNIFYTRTNDRIYSASLDGQTPDQLISPNSSSAKAATGSSMVRSENNNTIFFQNQNNDIAHANYVSGIWTVGPLNNSAPKALSDSKITWASAIKVLYVSSSNRITNLYWNTVLNQWSYREPHTSMPSTQGGKFAFAPGIIAYIAQNGQLCVTKWNGSIWASSLYTVQNSPDLNTDLAIEGQYVLYFSDGKLIRIKENGTGEEVLDDCAVRAINKSKLFAAGPEFLYQNLEEMLGVYNYLGRCKKGDDESIVDIEQSEILIIYPNPASEFFSIETELELSEIHLYSLDGRLVKTFLNKERCNVNDLPDGLYIVNAIDDMGLSHSSRIVIN